MTAESALGLVLSLILRTGLPFIPEPEHGLQDLAEQGIGIGGPHVGGDMVDMSAQLLGLQHLNLGFEDPGVAREELSGFQCSLFLSVDLLRPAADGQAAPERPVQGHQLTSMFLNCHGSSQSRSSGNRVPRCSSGVQSV